MSLEAFNLIKFCFVFFLIVAIAFLIINIFNKRKFSLSKSTTIVSLLICLIVSGFLLVFVGYAADELRINSEFYTSSTIFLVLLSLSNFIIISLKRNKASK